MEVCYLEEAAEKDSYSVKGRSNNRFVIARQVDSGHSIVKTIRVGTQRQIEIKIDADMD
jgi:mRNA-degrading endonuclease RelE of RelBE toxin-antitoxin system